MVVVAIVVFGLVVATVPILSLQVENNRDHLRRGVAVVLQEEEPAVLVVQVLPHSGGAGRPMKKRWHVLDYWLGNLSRLGTLVVVTSLCLFRLALLRRRLLQVLLLVRRLWMQERGLVRKAAPRVVVAEAITVVAVVVVVPTLAVLVVVEEGEDLVDSVLERGNQGGLF